MTTETASPPASASNGELIRWSFEQQNKRDSSLLRQLWTEETTLRMPDRTYVGAHEMAAYFDEGFAAVPDWNMKVIEIVERDEHVFVQWQLTGTHSGGAFQGVEPTGKRVTLDGMDHFVMRDGKVASNFVVFDQMQFARQIGMLPEDGSAPDKAMKAAFNAKTKLQKRFSGG
jgi:steroid delta-isomerase-like uncharacterized protein